MSQEFTGRDGEVLSYHIGDNPEYATIIHGAPKYTPVSPERKDYSNASRRNSIGTTTVRKRTLLRVQSSLGQNQEGDHENFHDTSSQYRPSAPSVDLMDDSDHGGMMTPHGSLASHSSDQFLAKVDTGGSVNTSVNTAGSLMKRESSLHEDHHAISEIFLGEAASLLKDFHEERQKGTTQKKEVLPPVVPPVVPVVVVKDDEKGKGEGEGKDEDEDEDEDESGGE